MDRYAEQLWLTLFAKAPEITLFDFRQLQRPIRETDRAAWQGIHTSFDFDEMVAPYRQDDWSLEPGLTIALAAGYTFEKVDRFLGELGEPIGVTSYRPHHATGEDFLHNFIGMAGIPIDLRPGFPADAQTIFLTESAKYDMNIVGKIKSQLMAGKTVVITSGLLHALQGKGIEDFVELEYTSRKALVKEFLVGWGSPVEAEEEILIPQIQYLTNDSWEQVSALDNGLGWPILHEADYADGSLYVLTIPDNFGELKSYPPAVWNRIKQTLMRDLYVRVESPGQVSLFVYDNDTFIVESFLDETVEVRIVIDDRIGTLRDLVSGEELEVEAPPERPAFFGPSPNTGKVFVTTEVKPHSYRVFKGL